MKSTWSYYRERTSQIHFKTMQKLETQIFWNEYLDQTISAIDKDII